MYVPAQCDSVQNDKPNQAKAAKPTVTFLSVTVLLFGVRIWGTGVWER